MNPYEQTVATTRGGTQQLATNKVLRNTYALLAMTLLFSAAAAGVSMVMNVSPGISLMCSVAALVLLWFVVPRTANSAAGLGVAPGTRRLAAAWMDTGRLVPLFGIVAPSPFAYYAVTDRGGQARPVVVDFIDWLLAAVATP